MKTIIVLLTALLFASCGINEPDDGFVEVVYSFSELEYYENETSAGWKIPIDFNTGFIGIYDEKGKSCLGYVFSMMKFNDSKDTLIIMCKNNLHSTCDIKQDFTIRIAGHRY